MTRIDPEIYGFNVSEVSHAESHISASKKESLRFAIAGSALVIGGICLMKYTGTLPSFPDLSLPTMPTSPTDVVLGVESALLPTSQRLSLVDIVRDSTGLVGVTSCFTGIIALGCAVADYGEVVHSRQLLNEDLTSVKPQDAIGIIREQNKNFFPLH